MELLELFTKAIAPQLLSRIFDNIPQYIIFFGFIGIFAIKYLLKWNKARIEKKKARETVDKTKAQIKEERSQAIFKNTENLIAKVDAIEKTQKETAEEIKVLKVGYNALDIRVVRIETRDEINSKQENAVMGMLNRIINSIDKK